MKFTEFVKILGDESYFDLATVTQLTGEHRSNMLMQLHRWCKEGQLLPLRRGVYAFPRTGGRRELNPAEIANKLYSPSYISTYWALGYYGVIPEKVVTYTSVTSRCTRSFTNGVGVFTYRALKSSVFFGYTSVRMGNRNVLLAEPEKALLDLWYLEDGLWDEQRMESMRFQNLDVMDGEKLQRYAERFQVPRLLKAVQVWERFVRLQTEGMVEL
jgi:predicted transcriptional regulator of viral defense system